MLIFAVTKPFRDVAKRAMPGRLARRRNNKALGRRNGEIMATEIIIPLLLFVSHVVTFVLGYRFGAYVTASRHGH